MGHMSRPSSHTAPPLLSSPPVVAALAALACTVGTATHSSASTRARRDAGGGLKAGGTVRVCPLPVSPPRLSLRPPVTKLLLLIAVNNKKRQSISRLD